MSPSRYDKDVAALAARLTGADTIEQAVELVTTFAADAFGTQHAGVTLIQHNGSRFAAAGPTRPSVREADELQDELSEGPCIDAATLGRSVVSNNIGEDRRWPTWGPRASVLGLGSILSSSLRADKHIGALNVYGPADHEFTSDDLELGKVLAQQAAVALRFSEKVEGLTAALGTRTVIGQAQGVLIERYRVDADRAFGILRRWSQEQNIRLYTVAKSIVDDAGANRASGGPSDTL